MNIKTSSFPHQPLLDATNPSSDLQDEHDEEFLRQNEMISKEIWKYDKALYCPLNIFRFFTLFYLLAFFMYLYSFFAGHFQDKQRILPKYLYYLESYLNIFFMLILIWAYILIGKVFYSKDPLKIGRPLCVFKVYAFYNLGFVLPVFIHYLKKSGQSSDSVIFVSTTAGLMMSVLLSGSSILLAIRVRNILLKNRPFHEASSFALLDA